jgi:hypothetical protein
VPGSVYYLGVQNTNSFAVNYGLEVDFHLVSFSPPSTNAIVITSITTTNISGTNGYLLKWQGPTNLQYGIQWTTNLAPLVSWNTILNPVINVVLTSTNGHYSFFDDGSLTGGLGPWRFYRITATPSAPPPPPPALSISSVTLTSLAGTNDLMIRWSAPTNYHYGVQWTTNLSLPFSSWISLTNPVLTQTNGVYTFIDNGQTGPSTSNKFFRLLEY